MKAIKPLLLSLSMLALACGTAQANDAKNKSDAQAKPSTAQSGSASTGSSAAGSKAPSASAGASASGDTSARYDFGKADKNKDGQLSRQEFDDMMKVGASAGGSGSSSGQTSSSTSGAAKTPAPASGKPDEKSRTSK
jgi:hypothetical protein